MILLVKSGTTKAQHDSDRGNSKIKSEVRNCCHITTASLDGMNDDGDNHRKCVSNSIMIHPRATATDTTTTFFRNADKRSKFTMTPINKDELTLDGSRSTTSTSCRHETNNQTTTKTDVIVLSSDRKNHPAVVVPEIPNDTKFKPKRRIRGILKRNHNSISNDISNDISNGTNTAVESQMKSNCCCVPKHNRSCCHHHHHQRHCRRLRTVSQTPPPTTRTTTQTVQFDAVHIREHSLTTYLPPQLMTKPDKRKATKTKTTMMDGCGGGEVSVVLVRLPVTLDWSHSPVNKSMSVDDYEWIRERRLGRKTDRGQLKRIPYQRRRCLLQTVGRWTVEDLSVAEHAWRTHYHSLRRHSIPPPEKIPQNMKSLSSSSSSLSSSSSNLDTTTAIDHRHRSKTVTYAPHRRMIVSS